MDNQVEEREESLLLADAVINIDDDICDCCEDSDPRSPDNDGICYFCTHPFTDHQNEYDGPLGSPYEWTS